jgi:cytoskeletal protein CcmA (bactofilin family)
MLPNFRRSESDTSKLQTTASASETPPAPPFQPRPFLSVQRTGNPKSVSIIGSDLTIAGNLICKGEVQVDGNVEGDIEGNNVVVGENATITGGISADEVVIRGHVIGSVHGRRVMLQTTSQVEGDIFHQSLSIEQGAMFEGKSRRTKDDPRTLLQKSEKAEPIAFAVPPRLPELAN